MVKIAYFAFFMLIMLVVVMCLLLLFGTLLKQKFALQQLFTAWVIIIFGIAIILHILVYFVTLQVFHVLLFLLAIQNFLRFFVSLRLLFLQTSIQKYVKRIYIFFILKDFVSFLISKFDNKLPQNVWHAGQILYLVTLLILNLLLPMMSPLIYTPIIVKTKINNTDMYSQHHAHIHKYVFWQNVSVFSFKTISLPYIFQDLDFVQIIGRVYIYDCFTTPLIIQLSYLWCNRHFLFTNFHFKTFVKVLLGKAESSVHPISAPIVFSIT